MHRIDDDDDDDEEEDSFIHSEYLYSAP